MVACAPPLPQTGNLEGAAAKSRKAVSLTLRAVKPGLGYLFSGALNKGSPPLSPLVPTGPGSRAGPFPAPRSERGPGAPASGSASRPSRRPHWLSSN